MVNSQVVSEISNALKIDERVEKIPNPIPVVEVGIKSIKNGLIRGIGLSNSTQITVLTTSAVADTYITGITLSLIKDATSTSTSVDVRCSINGAVTTLVSIPCFTLTPQITSIYVPFIHPVKLDRGANMTLNSTTNVANIAARVDVQYFLDEIN